MIENKLNEIKKAFDIIVNKTPVDGEKFIEMISDLTKCEIEYNIFVKPNTFIELNERFTLRIYEVRDRLYCNENKFIITAKVVDIFDNHKSMALIFDYKVLNIEQYR
jgi:hypothetical protein